MKGYYINLKHRIDRKKNIEDLKKKYPFFSNVKRMDAFCHKQGVLGCAMSHIKCLEELKKNSDDYYMILEDDFFINNENNFLAFLNDFDLIKHSNSWDVITMTPLGKTFKRNYINNFHKIVNTSTVSGIIVKHNFLDKLLEVFKKAKQILIETNKGSLGAIDVVWKPIQHKSNFIYFGKLFAGQIKSYSDIEKRTMNYQKYFNKQGKSWRF